MCCVAVSERQLPPREYASGPSAVIECPWALHEGSIRDVAGAGGSRAAGAVRFQPVRCMLCAARTEHVSVGTRRDGHTDDGH